MIGFIDNIVTFYEMRAKALDVLVTNTQKALKEFVPDKERKANEQAEKLEDFVRGLIRDINNMLTRFWFQKERKQMTDEQANSLVDFLNFTKTLTKEIRSLLTRFQRSQTFEEELDKEIKDIETHVKQRLKKSLMMSWKRP